MVTSNERSPLEYGRASVQRIVDRRPKTEAKLVNLDFYSETEQTISRMEKLVSELKVRVEQDDAVMDAGYRLRIQTLAALLMSLITARPTHQLSRRM